MIKKVIGHCCFVGHTGYAEHSREFFTELNKLIPVEIHNFAYCEDLSYLTEEQMGMLILKEGGNHSWGNDPFPHTSDPEVLNIVLLETNHYYFYHDYKSPVIFYNVWELPRYPQGFFNKLKECDRLWLPTECHKEWVIDQGYDPTKIDVVHEGVRDDLFKPGKEHQGKFRFIFAGRWDTRKNVPNTIRVFLNVFKDNNDVELWLSADNPFNVDGMSTTEERLKHYGLEDDKIKVVHFPPFEKYLKVLQEGHVFLSSSTCEGWHLPLIQAMSCGIPSICTDYGPPLEYARGIAHTVKVNRYESPNNMFNTDVSEDLGTWAVPDNDDLERVILDVYENYTTYRKKSLEHSEIIRSVWGWKQAASRAFDIITDLSTHLDTIVDCGGSGGSQDGVIRLNLGSGNSILPGYINIDKSNGNADENWDIISMPIEDDYADEILISHVLEHFSIPEVPTILHQLNRILKVGGKLEIRVPDMEQAVKAWQNADDRWQHLSYELLGAQDYFDNTHKCGFTMETLPRIVKAYGFRIDSCNVDGNQLILLGTKIKNDQIYAPTIKQHWVSGAYVHLDDCYGKYYQVNFLDGDGNHVHSCNMTDTWWTRTNRKYYTDWNVQISLGDELMYNYKMVLNRERVLISLDSKSLGDTLAWIPYVEEFRKKHNCEVFCSTFWNHILDYPNLNLIEPGSVYKNIYAGYTIGCWEGNTDKNPREWQTILLQEIATDILGLDYKEIRTHLKPAGKSDIEGKYVCISEWSTLLRKHWNFKGGWQEIVNYLNKEGYKVVVVSLEETGLENIIDRTNRSIEESIAIINGCDFYIGLGHGPAWLAWALKKKVIMISPFSDFCEFQLDCYRIDPPEGICRGCLNDVSIGFDRGGWDDCPRDKDFECSKSITPDMVIKKIEEMIHETIDK